MTEIESTTDLAKRVHDIVQRYVMIRTEMRAGMSWEAAKTQATPDAQHPNRRLMPREYREAREKVCQGAFLAMRACRARQDFVEHFTGTICAVPQFLPPDQYQLIAQALYGSGDQWEQVKGLSMLTLSAMSQV